MKYPIHSDSKEIHGLEKCVNFYFGCKGKVIYFESKGFVNNNKNDSVKKP